MSKREVTSQNILAILMKNRMFIILVALIVFMTFASPVFFTTSNFLNVLRQISINGIVALGISFVITIGCIDLSVGSTVGLAGIVMGQAALLGWPTPIVILIGLGVGLAVGVLNGLGIAIFRIPPFVATLAMQNAIRGLAYIFCDGMPLVNFEDRYVDIGQGYWLGIPVPVYILAAVAIICAIIFNKTKFGRNLFYTGGNEQAAQISGINVFKIKVTAYAICGMLAGLAGVVLSFRVASAMPVNGDGYEGDAIAAAVIGGAAMRGGYSTVRGTIIGALILGIISNGMPRKMKSISRGFCYAGERRRV